MRFAKAMVIALNTFRNVRARLLRPGEDVPIPGWVAHLGPEQAHIQLLGEPTLTRGERVQCECFGMGNVARFTTAVAAQNGADVALVILGSIAYDPSAEPPRIRVAGLHGRIRGSRVQASLAVVDLSPASLGAIVDAEIAPDDELTMHLPTENGAIEAKVAIANIRPHRSKKGSFRAGLHLVEMSRLDRARWGRLLVERAEA